MAFFPIRYFIFAKGGSLLSPTPWITDVLKAAYCDINHDIFSLKVLKVN